MRQQISSIQVICDLRAAKLVMEDPKQVETLWQKIAPSLVGQIPIPGQRLVAQLDNQSSVSLWVVDSRQSFPITNTAAFTIVDIVRPPAVIYLCRICKAHGKQVYGPLQCRDCLDNKNVEEGQERLCSDHASFVPGRLDAYCPEHKPHCQCKPQCKHEATFYCDHCNRPFGNHSRHPHPTEMESNKWYCFNCYRSLFSTCVVCWRQGKKKSLGKLSCAYVTEKTKNPCDVWLCREHAQQWKIWGPHHQGITLCEEHKKCLHMTAPTDLLAMMLTAAPPRGAYFRLSNAFRLRRILNRNQDTALSLQEMALVLQQLCAHTATWNQYAQKLYSEVQQAIARALERQATLLEEVKTFYQYEAGSLVADALSDLIIAERFSSRDAQGNPTEQLFVDLYVQSDAIGQYYGRSRHRIEQLKQRFHFTEVRIHEEHKAIRR